MSMASRLNENDKTFHKIEHKVDKNTAYLKQLAYHSIDVEARSRRNNLIFYGLADSYNEDTYALLNEFFEFNLNIDLSTMCIQRVHRLGSIGRARSVSHTPRRPIIAGFRDYKDTEYILEQASMLQNTRFGIDRDYPKEISEARKRLWGQYKLEKSKRRSNVRLLYPAKLVVNGDVIADEFPDWHEIMQLDRLSLFRPAITGDQNINVTVNHSVFSTETDIDSRGSLTSKTQSTCSSSSTCTQSQDMPTPTTLLNTDVSPMATQTSHGSNSTQSSPSILREPKLNWPNVNNAGVSSIGQSQLRTGERILTSTPTTTGSGKLRADQPINNNGNR